jgi:hypothetical protein
MIKRNIIALACFVILSTISTISAGPFALFGSFQTTHSTLIPTGGLRYSLNDDICFDMSLGAAAGYSADASNGISGYADAFFYKQSIGVGVTLSKWGDADLITTVGLLYALEKPINENIILGVAPTIVSKTFSDGYGVDFLSGFALYTVISW